MGKRVRRKNSKQMSGFAQAVARRKKEEKTEFPESVNLLGTTIKYGIDILTESVKVPARHWRDLMSTLQHLKDENAYLEQQNHEMFVENAELRETMIAQANAFRDEKRSRENAEQYMRMQEEAEKARRLATMQEKKWIETQSVDEKAYVDEYLRNIKSHKWGK